MFRNPRHQAASIIFEAAEDIAMLHLLCPQRLRRQDKRPGAWLNTLSQEQREVLKHLKAEDIQLRDDLVERYVPSSEDIKRTWG